MFYVGRCVSVLKTFTLTIQLSASPKNADTGVKTHSGLPT
jgi:hypothetical protein